MSLVVVFLVGCLFLGLFVGPLGLALLTRALSDDLGHRLGDWAVGLGLKSVWRPALTFAADDELTLKRRAYDEEHDAEKITFGGIMNGVERFLYNPQDRLHDFFGTPFGFVDERFGIIIDPRDAVVASLGADAEEAGRYTSQRAVGGQLVESVLGVFEVPGDQAGARLRDVWWLVGGSADSQLVRKIREFYRKAQAPKTQTTALRQLLVPVGTFIAIVLLGIFASGQMGGGGGGGVPAPPGGNSSTVNIGESWLFMLVATMPLADYSRRDKAVIGGVAALCLGIAALLFVAFPVVVPLAGIPLPLGVWGVVAIGIGVALGPFIASFFGRSLGPVGMLLGKLYITIGLLAYDRPVIQLTGSNTYGLVEYGAHEWGREPQFYRAFLTRLGVGLANDVEVWGEEITERPASVEAMAAPDAVADGGAGAPGGYALTDMIAQDSILGHVPETVDPTAQYVRTDLTTGWYLEAGQNRRLMTAALESAKEKFGGGNKPVSDKYVLGATLAAMVLGAVFDWVVFFS